jgi:transcriptional regulator of arginine metabolism
MHDFGDYMTKDPHAPKHERQTRLLDIVRSQQVATQEELATRLQQAGVDCTQASVSRDIRELGLVKRGGIYAAPQAATAVPDLDAFAAKIGIFLQQMTVVGEHLVVIHTLPGTAHSVGLYLDGMSWPGLVGTIAGDDTLFAAVADSRAGRRVVRALEEIREASS